MANPNQDARNRAGRYVRTLETATRDARAAELRAEGWTLQRIADELGYGSHASAREGIRRALKEIVQGPAEKLLALYADRLEGIFQRSMEIAEADHVVVSHGKIITDDDGKPLRDHGPTLAAFREARSALADVRKMVGLDQPTKVDATVHQVTQEDVELAELIREAQAKNAVEEARIKGETS